MDSKEFKKVFNNVAKVNCFKKAYGGWFKESSECIVVLDLQKSSYGDYHELNVKVFVQGLFGIEYKPNKNMIKKYIGDIFTRQPNYYKDVLDFDIYMDDEKRKERLESLFNEFIIPFTNKAISRLGLKELAEQEKIFLLPAVKEELL